MLGTRKSAALLVLLTLCAALAWPTPAIGQDVSLTGTVTDSTDAVLPGVTVTAVHVDTGNTYLGVTDGSGVYGISGLRTGRYQVKAELPGFATVTQDRVELLVGQRGVLNYKLALSSVQETVTVTTEAPLVDMTQSKLGGNIDARQVQALPVSGRNWMQLTMLAPGSRVNAVDDSPLGTMAGAFQLNLDGQQVTATQTYSGTVGQPRFSRDAIGEFAVASSRFDATSGRSSGVQVNAVTKAGTNTLSGTVSGYFRDDRFNAKDFIVNRVLGYSNQQFVTTVGGPIRKDRVHFFAYYEGDREPQSIAFSSPYPRFNIPDLRTTKIEHQSGGRVDVQLSDSRRLMFRGNVWTRDEPMQGARTNTGLNHPSTLTKNNQGSSQLFASFNQTIGSRTLLEIKGGYSNQGFKWDGIVPPSPTIQLIGYTIGRGTANPLEEDQRTYSLRADYSTYRGRMEFKIGGEWLLPSNYLLWSSSRYGVIVANLGPPPANLQDLFPVWNDPSTWNLAALSPITRQYNKAFGTFNVHCASNAETCRRAKPQYGVWLQDNWQVSQALMLNLGLRWDFALDGFANDVDLPPVRSPAPQEWDKFGPRLGFTFHPGDSKTVLRGGWGLYFAGVVDHNQHFLINKVAAIPETFNDGRPNFAADPFNLAGGGREPTYEQVLQLQQGYTGRRQFLSQPTAQDARTAYSHQTSMGFQHQLADSLSVQADVVWIAGRREEINPGNVNLTFNPVTGANYPFRNPATRRWPDFGIITSRRSEGRSDYHALETAFTKRFSRSWQAQVTYTLSRAKDCDPLPPNAVGPTPVDLGGECGLSAGGSFTAPDQRHRASLNGIWELPITGMQLSGLYFYGSGQRFRTFVGVDPRDSGALSTRLRANGTIVPRNNFVGEPLHRVDVRLQQRIPLVGSATIDAIAEVFNLFNHENYGNYTTNESSAAYGRPAQVLNVAYQPRTMQFGFRVMF